MTPHLDLDTIEAAASAAESQGTTDDQWHQLDGREVWWDGLGGSGLRVAVVDKPADAHFIATANPETVLLLVAEVRRLRSENERSEANAVEDSAYVQGLESENERLREALDGIVNHPHNAYDSGSRPGSPDDLQYSTGVTDGHRCAAEHARAALSRPVSGKGGER